ncbi:MAG: hypothetical protein E6R03_12520 [Hyphomicrobiaceae bacterium]|nr:MAG: hypothetical protein E6R03_12520 [Hyphomicrobiaceae bacterium]
MSRKTVEFVFASAVTTNGTFTVSYPTGYTKGDFSRGVMHRLIALQSTFESPKGITCSFGASSVTVTYKGTTTIPAGSKGIFGFDIAGPDTFRETDWKKQNHIINRPAILRFVNFGSPSTVSTTALISAATGTEMPATAASITYTYATQGGSSPIDGANTDGKLYPARNIVTTVTHASSVPTMTVTHTFLDVNGNQAVETHTTSGGGTSNTITGSKAAAQLISTKIANASTTQTTTGATLNVGFGSKLGFDIPILDSTQIAMEIHDGAMQGVWRGNEILPFALGANEVGTGGVLRRIPAPINGRIVSAYAAVEVANNANNAGTIAISIEQTNSNGSGVTVAGCELAFAASATIGTVVSGSTAEGAATAEVSTGNQICVVATAGFSTNAQFSGSIVMRPTYTVRGTLAVADITTVPSGTSGDIYGTYTPAFTLDGSKQVGLLVWTPEPNSNGTPQYTV